MNHRLVLDAGRASVAACCLVLALPSLAQAKKPSAPAGLTIEQALNVAMVREVAMSPDGRWVAYTVATPPPASEPKGKYSQPLWVMRPDAPTPRRYMLEGTSIHAVRFTPDSQRITFLATRGGDEHTQLWALAVDGGEAERVVEAADGVLDYRLSPDGKRVAYLTLAEEPEELVKARKDGRDEQVWSQDIRHQIVRIVDLGPLETDKKQGTEDKVEPLAAGPADRTSLELDWSPDGTQLAVMHSATPRMDDQYMFRTLSIFPVPPSGTKPTKEKATVKGRVLATKMGKMVHPRWSPDSKHVAWLGAATKSDGTDGTIWLVAAAGGKPRALNAGAEETVYDLDWIGPDALLTAAVRGTHSFLSRRDLAGAAQTLFGGAGAPVFLSAAVDKAASRLALAGATNAHPAELFVGAFGKELRRVSRHSASIAGAPLGKVETVSWRSARDNLLIEGVLTYPVGYKKGTRYPLVLKVHGGPEWQALEAWDSYYLAPPQVLAARGFAVLAPNYRGSSGRGAAFATANHRDLGGLELMDNVDGVGHLAREGIVDPKRVGMVGGSYGGYMAALAATKASQSFAAAVDFAGIANWLSFTGTSDIPYENSIVHWDLWCYDAPGKCREGSPMNFIDNAKTPLLLIHGAADRRVPVGQAKELHTAFRVRGIPTELVVYPRAGHGLREQAQRRDATERTIAWFERWLKKGGHKKGGG